MFMNASSVKSRVLYARFLLSRPKAMMRGYSEQLDARRTLVIDPGTLDYCIPKAVFAQQEQSAYVPVISGDWDLQARRIETLDEYAALEAEMSRNAGMNKDSAEIAVAIGRNGQFLLADGLRALLTVRKLKRSQTPARVVARHRQWQELRKELFTLSLEKHLYQPLLHPDLDFPAEHPCEDRFNIISENLSARKGELLDIGASFGYFCHRFEDAGFECYALENSPRPLYYLRKLRKVGNKSFTIIPQDILEWRGYDKLQFDVVIALNILHHFIKNKKSYAKLIRLLNGLKTKEMFFEACLDSELPVESPLKNNTENGFVDFISENTGLKKAELIGTAKDGRHIYKLC